MTSLRPILWLAALLTLSSAYAAPSLESYGKLEQVSDISISPNGELIAYRRTESDENDFVVVYSLKEGKMKTGLNVSDIDPHGQFFINNDYLILKGSRHVDLREYKHDFDISTAFSFNVNNSKVEQLIKLGETIGIDKTVHIGQTGLGRVLGKNTKGTELYIPAYVADSAQDESPNYSLLKVKVSGKGKPRIHDKGSNNARDYFVDNNGKLVAREILKDRSDTHAIEVKKGNNWKTIYSYQSTVPTHKFIGLNNDFTTLVFSRNDEAGYSQLDLSSGEIKPFKIKRKDGYTTILRSMDEGIIGLRYSGLSPSYQMFDKKLDDRIQKIIEKFPGHSIYIVDWSKGWKQIIVRIEGSMFAGDYYLMEEGKEARFLVSSRMDIKTEEINPIATVTFKARDGLHIPTLLTIPRENIENFKNLPTVVLPHGGPASQDEIGFDYEAQALASRGFLVVQPQFRGSTGFGKKHYEAGWGEWGKAMQDDLTDSVNFLVRKGYTDPKRVCIVGGSYGGYAALAGAAFTPDLYKCAVSIAGVSHLPKMLAADKSRYGKDDYVLDYWNRSILAGEYDKDALKSISPYYSADKIKVPVLLIHGEDDTVVEYEQSKVMYKAIKKAGGKVELVKLKKDDHHLRDGSTRTQALKAMVEFVQTHIGS